MNLHCIRLRDTIAISPHHGGATTPAASLASYCLCPILGLCSLHQPSMCGMCPSSSSSARCHKPLLSYESPFVATMPPAYGTPLSPIAQGGYTDCHEDNPGRSFRCCIRLPAPPERPQTGADCLASTPLHSRGLLLGAHSQAHGSQVELPARTPLSSPAAP